MPQKLSTTILPRKSLRLRFRPSKVGRVKSGACLPSSGGSDGINGGGFDDEGGFDVGGEGALEQAIAAQAISKIIISVMIIKAFI